MHAVQDSVTKQISSSAVILRMTSMRRKKKVFAVSVANGYEVFIWEWEPG